MTTLIDTLRAAAEKARKARQSVAATLLVTLVSEASRIGKDAGGREPTDEEVVKKIGYFLDGVEQSLAHLEKDASTATDVKKALYLTQLREEREILRGYMPEKPPQMTEAELTSEIKRLVDALPEKGMKHMGAVMAALKEQFAGRFDGAVAGSLAKQALMAGAPAGKPAK